MEAMYGYTVLPKDDPFQELAEETVNALTALTYPSAAVVNVIPFLRFLPTWFPGADFHRVARETKDKLNKLLDSPYTYVQDNLVGTIQIVSPNYNSNMFQGRRNCFFFFRCKSYRNL